MLNNKIASFGWGFYWCASRKTLSLIALFVLGFVFMIFFLQFFGGFKGRSAETDWIVKENLGKKWIREELGSKKTVIMKDTKGVSMVDDNVYLPDMSYGQSIKTMKRGVATHIVQMSSEPLVPDALVDYVPGTGPRVDRIYKPDDDEIFDPWLDEVRADRSWLSDINRADDVWPRPNTTLLFYSCTFSGDSRTTLARFENLKFFLRHGVFHDHDPLYPAEYHFLLSFGAGSPVTSAQVSPLFFSGTNNTASRVVHLHVGSPGIDIAAYSRLIRELGESYVNKFTYFGAMNCDVRGPLLPLHVASSTSSSTVESSCKVHAHFLPHYLRRLGVYGRSFVAQTGMKALCNVDYAEDHVESLVVFYHRIAFPVLYRQWKIFDDGTSSMNNGVIGVSIRVNRLGWFMSSDDYLPFRAIRGISTTNCTKRDVVAEIIVPESSSSSLPLFMRNAGGNFGCGDVCDKELQSLLASQSQVYTQNLKACVTAH